MTTVSVVMSVYKEPLEWLHESIDSILYQTFKDFEFIIICDNPEYKEGIELLNEYRKQDDRIIVIYNEQNIGLTKSLNKGLEIAKGRYIARMDADDVAMKNRLQVQVDYMENNTDENMCHTDYYIIDECEVVVDRIKNEKEFKQAWLFREDMIAHPTVMFRSELLFMRKPLYNEDFKNAQDYELWSFFTLNNVGIGYIPEKLLKYRVSGSQVSAKSKSSQLDNGRRIRRDLINGFFIQRGVKLATCDSILAVYKLVDNYEGKNNNEKEYIKQIKYVVAYSLALEKKWNSYKRIIPLVFAHGYSFKNRLYLLLAPAFGNRWPLYEY